MAPAPFPTPLPAYARAALGDLTTVASVYHDLVQYLENLTTDEQWRRLQIVCDNIATGAVVQDKMIMTFDITNITGGQLDSTWDTTDYTTCESKFTTFLTTMTAHMQAWARFSQYRWYTMRFNPPTTSKPFQESGPPQRIQTLSLAGSGTNYQAPQVAISVTEKTSWAKHWGRFYLPGINGTAMKTGGRIDDTLQASINNAVGTLYSDLAAADFQIQVPVTQVDKAPQRILLNVTGTQIDDVPDVVRRRRPRNTLKRLVKP